MQARSYFLAIQEILGVVIYLTVLSSIAVILSVLQCIFFRIKSQNTDSPPPSKTQIREHKKFAVFLCNIIVAAAYHSVALICGRIVLAFLQKIVKDYRAIQKVPSFRLGDINSTIFSTEKPLQQEMRSDEEIIIILFGVLLLGMFFKKLHQSFSQFPHIYTIVAFEGMDVMFRTITDYIFFQKLPTTVSAKIESFAGMNGFFLNFTIFRYVYSINVTIHAFSSNFQRKFTKRIRYTSPGILSSTNCIRSGKGQKILWFKTWLQANRFKRKCC